MTQKALAFVARAFFVGCPIPLRRSNMAKKPSLPKPAPPPFDGIEEFVRMTDWNRHVCRCCGEDFGGGTLEWQVTHYLKNHKFKLLYICKETERGVDNAFTVVYVGGPASQMPEPS